MTEPDRNSLSDRISRAQAAQENTVKAKQQEESSSGASAGAMALRYGAEFGATMIVGVMLGLGIDTYFKTKPWGLLIMMGFGLAAGVLGVIRAYRELTVAANAAMSSPETGSETEESKN